MTTPCTWNPADKGSGIILSNGNRTASVTAVATARQGVRATTSRNTVGNWQFEVAVGAFTGTQLPIIGVSDSSAPLTQFLGATNDGWGYYGFSGQTLHNNTSSSYGAAYTTGDIIGAVYNAATGALSFYKNGVSQGVAFGAGVVGPAFPTVSAGGATTTDTCLLTLNAGEFPFSFPVGGAAPWDPAGRAVGNLLSVF